MAIQNSPWKDGNLDKAQLEANTMAFLLDNAADTITKRELLANRQIVVDLLTKTRSTTSQA